jgi:hypothetical protein
MMPRSQLETPLTCDGSANSLSEDASFEGTKDMLLLIHFEITPEARNNVLNRLKTSAKREPPGVKTVAGPWYSVTQLEGWGVVEAESAIALGQLMHAWTDLTVDHITPVLSAEDVLKLIH